MLETDLAPEQKGSEIDRNEAKSNSFRTCERGQKSPPSIKIENQALESATSNRRRFGTTVEELLRKYKEESSV